MKIILTENQIEFIRRYKKIKELVDEGIDVLSNDEDFCGFNYSAFIEEVCWQVSDKMEHLNLPTDTVGMIENVHKWVTDNFDEYIRKEFDRVIVDNPNCDDADDLDSSIFGVDNIQESIEDDNYNFSLRNAIKRRYNDIIYEMERYLHNEIDCDDWEENEFVEWILETVTDEMMFNYGIDNWEWSDLNDELSNILKDRINSFYKYWTTNNC